MTHVLEIDAEPALGEEAILAALRHEGVEGSVMDVAPHLRLQVPGRDLAAAVAVLRNALDRVLLDRALPLVTERVGASMFVVRPPAG